MMTFRRKVQHGQKNGRKIGFPTLNVNPGSFGRSHSPGVYACRVEIGGKSYRGALHYGPKGSSRKNVLEIHALGFSQEVYGSWIAFEATKKLREPMKFDSWEELKKQIEKDLRSIVQ